MSVLEFARTAAFVLGVLGFGAAQAAARPRPLRRLDLRRRPGGRGLDEWLDRARRGEWFSRALTALWSRCDTRARKDNDKLGALDFDVATNSQGLEVKRFTVKTLSGDASHGSVVTKLAPDNWARKSDHENEIRYELVWESDARQSTTSIP